jgi:hypothetical protein
MILDKTQFNCKDHSKANTTICINAIKASPIDVVFAQQVLMPNRWIYTRIASISESGNKPSIIYSL